MTKKIKRVLPYTPKWERDANALARNFAPNIYPCVHCGHPVVSGYMCTFCGRDPDGDAKEKKEFYDWILEQRKSNEQD